MINVACGRFFIEGEEAGGPGEEGEAPPAIGEIMLSGLEQIG